MKKIYLILLMLVTSFLIASCSAAYDGTNIPLSIYDHISFNFDTMTYTSYDSYDIVYDLGNPFDDFVILHENLYDSDFETSEKDAYAYLIDMLYSVGRLTNKNMTDMLAFSSADIKTLLEIHYYTVTIEDIVTFNNLKDLVDTMKQTMTSTDYYIQKTTYIETRLNITLSSTDIYNLELLQEKYIELKDVESDLDFKRFSFDDLITIGEHYNYYLSDEVKTDMESAYDILIQLI